MSTHHGDRNPADDSSGAVSARSFGRDRHSVVAREKEEFGGVKVGSAFFGWLTATGTAVLLTALAAAAGTAVGIANNTDAEEAASDPTVGLVGGIVLLVILFLAYYCGGYVAGRMARFNGAKQGLAVWIWGLVIAIAVAVLAAIAGDQFDVLAQVNSFPRIPVSEGDVTTGGIITLLLVAVASLAGAVLGGLAGMRFHRRVDRAGLGR
jgi:membrane protease YdiL (CAAX protease family)